MDTTNAQMAAKSAPKSRAAHGTRVDIEARQRAFDNVMRALLALANDETSLASAADASVTAGKVPAEPSA